MKKIIEGWLGGNWDEFGIYSSKDHAERAMFPDDEMHVLMKNFDCKKVRIIIEEIEG